MYQIEVRRENESPEETRKFIEDNRNWDVKSQSYKVEENCKANLSDCQIYWRGEFLIVEHEGIVHYWDSYPYCFLKQAVDFMQLEKPAKWKTLDKLINFRAAIRQTEVNFCGYVDDILMEQKMSLATYREFMALAREQDLEHHGSHTF